MSDDDDRDWEDITEDFRLTAAELKIGVLIHDKSFTLHDGMTAVEMMHPQMDIGTTRAQTRPILRFFLTIFGSFETLILALKNTLIEVYFHGPTVQPSN